MSKKPSSPEPNEQGLLHHGMFIEDTKPKTISDPEEMVRWFDHQIAALNAPTEETLLKVESWLRQLVELWTHPFGEEDALTAQRHHVMFSEGKRTVILNDDAPPQARDCLRAITELATLRGHLKPEGNLDWLVRSSIHLGRLMERIMLREFEPLVLYGRVSRSRSSIGGLNSSILKTDEDLRLFSIVREKHRDKYNQYTAISKEMTGHGLKMSPKTASRYAAQLDELDNSTVVQK